MDYLERNRALLEEIRRLCTLRRGELVGESDFSGTRFASLGSYNSGVLDGHLFLGLKEYSNKRWERTSFADSGLAHELTIIDAISKSTLRDELPVVFGHLRDKEGKHIGVLCEDFSQGGRYEVKCISYRQTELMPRELRKIFGATGFEMDDKDQLEYVGFMVNGKRRLGDFNSFLGPRLAEEVRGYPTFDAITRDLEHYIVRAELK